MPFPIAGALSLVGGLFGGGGNKDAARMAEADQHYQLALNGDVKAEVMLRCHAGIADPRAVTYGMTDNPTKCGYATSTAKSYAAGLVAKLDAVRKLGPIASGLGSTLSTYGATVAPLPNVDSVAGQAIVSGGLGLPSWVFPAAIAAGLLWVVMSQQKGG